MPNPLRPSGSTSTPALQPVAPRRIDFAKLTAATTAYMDQAERANAAAIEQDGVGLRYGEKSPFAKLNPAQRYEYVRHVVAMKHPGKENDRAYVQGLVSRMRSTSCIGYAMEGLEAGYKAAGQGQRWKEIQTKVRAAGVIGNVLLQELQKDGWEAVYFNADTSEYRGPTATANDRSRAGDHTYFQSRFIARDGTFKPGVDAQGKPIPGRDYYGVYPKYAVTNFVTRRGGQQPSLDATALAKMKRIPYFVGIAASGYHTFPGVGTKVRDSHVARDPDDRTNIENRGFEQLDFAWDTAARRPKTDAAGNPLFSEEQSGIFVVPPGTFGR